MPGAPVAGQETAEVDHQGRDTRERQVKIRGDRLELGKDVVEDKTGDHLDPQKERHDIGDSRGDPHPD